MNWYPLSQMTRSDNVKMITRSEAMLNDNFGSVGDIFVDNLKGFNEHRLPTREMPYKNRMWTAITYELSQDKTEYYRNVYSFLDLLSDVGGLYGSLSAICILLVHFFQYRSSY